MEIYKEFINEVIELLSTFSKSQLESKKNYLDNYIEKHLKII